MKKVKKLNKVQRNQEKGEGSGRSQDGELDLVLSALSANGQPIHIDGKGWLTSGVLYRQLLGSTMDSEKPLLSVEPAQLALVATGLATQAKDNSAASAFLAKALALIAKANSYLKDANSALSNRLAPERPDRLFSIKDACTHIGIQRGTLRKWIEKLRPQWSPPSDPTQYMNFMIENSPPHEWVDWRFRRKGCPTYSWLTMELVEEIRAAHKKEKQRRAKAGFIGKENAKKREERKYGSDPYKSPL